MRRPSYAPPGWGQPPPSPRTPTRARALGLLVAAIVGTVGVVWFLGRYGIITAALAGFVVLAIRRGWTVAACAATALLVLTVTGPTLPSSRTTAAPHKKVAAAPAAGQLDGFRCGAVNLYAEMAAGFPALPVLEPCPAPKKGHR